ncbi:DNA polymerase III subunit delta' [Nocardioidaceae bacterium]|nr:DNA polymerase III subunit delta' [Nocardioidaceae bacterium]
MSVWDRLVGQDRAVETLARAVGQPRVGHAWLFTGPPGSGRSNAAVAFAAALHCPRNGCGKCKDCRTTLAGSHADVTVLRTERLSLGVDEVRDLVRHAALAPVGGGYQVMVVEDADRLTEQAANALLKAVEEPSARTVWLLCAPTVEDVLPTIRSRTRLVTLTTPTAAAVADFLAREAQVSPEVAAYAARASQGHVGRARALATQEQVRRRREDVVRLPPKLEKLADAMNAATNLVEATKEEAEELTAALDAREKSDLDLAHGLVARGRRSSTYNRDLSEIEKNQKTRAKRRVLDVVDRCLMDLVSYYRDVVAVAVHAGGDLVNEEHRAEVETLARRIGAEGALRRIEAIFTAREQMLEFNVQPQLALESMMTVLMLPPRSGVAAAR